MESPGDQIGPYKLLQQIGEGGMGVVYMAEQKEPVKRRVALKVIKPGMDSRQVIARFEAERQALAMMDHPNIARVLDAGQTDSGRPYFVMELVNGIPVTEYCDEQRLTPTERLRLFVPICHAVQHAHQKGVIHRDLKPSNILVALYDGQAVPKVIDFGVAKATSQSLTEKTLFTQFGQTVGTLEYMSPEQAERNQLDVDTRSDIYSLGVVLYELLVGDTPFGRGRLRSAAFHEMLRILREEDPPRPSTKLSTSKSLPTIAANRRVEPASLTGALRGDLDWIVMKALEKDRSRRYETASALADDIDRYLADDVVFARPPSRAYRLRKFAHRNRALLTGIVAVLLALLLGLIGVSWQLVRVQHAERAAQDERRIAEQERAEAEAARAVAAANLLKARSAVSELVDVATKLAEVPETDAIRRELVDSALAYYKDFLLANRDNPKMRADVASTYFHVAMLQQELGQWHDSLASLEQSLDLLPDVVEGSQPSSELQRTLADVYLGRGVAHRRLGDIQDAVADLRTATEIREALVAATDQNSDQIDLARDYHNLAIVLNEEGDGELAFEFGDRSLRIAQKVLGTDPDNYDYRTRVARGCGFLGMLKAEQAAWGEAESYFRVCSEMHTKLLADRPDDHDCRRRIAVTHGWLANLAAHKEDFEAALQHSLRATDIGENLVQSFPTRYRYRAELANHYLTLASTHNAMGTRSAAMIAYQNSIDLARGLAAQNSRREHLMNALRAFGEHCLEHEEWDQAVEAFRELMSVAVEAEASQATRGRVQGRLGLALTARGLSLLKTDTTVALRDLKQGRTYLQNAYSELSQNQGQQPLDSIEFRTDILEGLIQVETQLQNDEAADRWRTELQGLGSD